MPHDHEYDMKAHHYQPAGRAPVCGAGSRVVERQEAGTVTPHTVLKIKSTTDVRKVTCLHCRQWITNIVKQYGLM